MMMALALVLYGVCLAWLAIEDMRRFEIKLELLAPLGGLGIYLAHLAGAPWWDIAAGGAVWGAPAAVYYRLHPGRIGQGDIWLLATTGLCVGLQQSILASAILAVAFLISAYCYARARSKPFGRSIIPAALPITVALLILCQWRAVQGGYGPVGPVGPVPDWPLAYLTAPLLGVLLSISVAGFTFRTNTQINGEAR